MYKRKHRKYDGGDKSTRSASHGQLASHDFTSLYIQAHEAEVIHGLTASARALEYRDQSAGSSTGSGLVRWRSLECSPDADTVGIHAPNPPALWVDRYDVRLLLDHLPQFQLESTQARSHSPSGWSDLPSDSEDTFFFSPDEVEDYRRKKRRRLIDRSREERLRVLATIDGEEQEPDPWGGSDEEPDETQRKFIRRTASHIISSPNPAQLEMRILANYGGDKRFAFLRGRWSRVWRTEKERAKQQRQQQQQQQAEETKKTQLAASLAPLGELASYGDSDTDSDAASVDDVTSAPSRQDNNINEDAAIKEARRTRAKEWSAQRRAEQSSQLAQT